MQYRASSFSPMSSSVTILLVWYVVFLSENQTSPAFGDVCIKNCLRITCILGSHKMKGILRVILPEEPDLEGNISQLGGKYYNISLACIYHTKKTSCTCTSLQASWQITTMKWTYSAHRLHSQVTTMKWTNSAYRLHSQVSTQKYHLIKIQQEYKAIQDVFLNILLCVMIHYMYHSFLT